jgi:hypothetical protein
MVTGLLFVLFGVLVILHPELLAYLFGGLCALFGAGMMLTAWQFRRLKRSSQSRFVNWIIRY